MPAVVLQPSTRVDRRLAAKGTLAKGTLECAERLGAVGEPCASAAKKLHVMIAIIVFRCGNELCATVREQQGNSNSNSNGNVAHFEREIMRSCFRHGSHL